MSRSDLKVIYITSSARSGSTLMDLILGSTPDAVSGGELRRTVPVGCVENGICTCRRVFSECTFWMSVMDRWSVDPIKFYEEQRSLTRIRRAWRLYAGIGIGGGRAMRSWCRDLSSFYTAIAAVSDTRCIIDSSKSPMYALALEACPGIDLRIIHLVRDPRGVAWSLGKDQPVNAAKGVPAYVKPQSVRKSAIEWRLANSLSERLARCLPETRQCKIQYEDVVADWPSARKKIESSCDIELIQDLKDLEVEGSIPTRHMLAGNRLRQVDSISIKSDESWKTQMPEDWRSDVERICGKQMSRFGYQRMERGI